MIGERIRRVRKALNLNQTEFSGLIGTGQDQVSRWEKNLHVPSDLFLEKMAREFSINPDWLETGEGEMFVDPSVGLSETTNDRFNYNVTKQVSREDANMWVVPIRAQAGFVKGFERDVFRQQIQRVAWPMVGGECFCFEVEGDSMLPIFQPKDWVVCKVLDDVDWLKEGRCYVFQTHNGLYIKRFEGIQDGQVHIHSVNPHHADLVNPIPLADLIKVYSIEGRYLTQ
jgi:phage repressor protein C with HTH and peptisase S24 domain